MRSETRSQDDRRWFNRLKHLTGLDRAIAFTVLARVWSGLAGAITVVLISRFLTPQEQGYYYTFASLVAVQLIFELGCSFVILQLAAHERATLTIHANGRVEGERVAHARFASILQQAVRWYSVATIVMAATLIGVGFSFFATHQQPTSTIQWKAPWAATVLASSVTFLIDPVFSFLEGCGKVSDVARLRFGQAILGSLLAWLALITHHGLFSPAMMIVGQAVVGFWFVHRYQNLLLPLLRHDTGLHKIRWFLEVWPFQWRIAATWASAYMILQLFNPVLFAYQGPVVAGRMGMSLNIANAVGAIALAWLSTKAAPFGTLVANRHFAQLDRLFARTLYQSTAILLAGDCLLLGALALLARIMPGFSARILPIPVFLLILLTVLCTHIVTGEAYYLRAHKREPLVPFWLVIAVLSVVTTLWTGKRWGAAGVTIGYFVLGGITRLSAATSVFFVKKKEWHSIHYR